MKNLLLTLCFLVTGAMLYGQGTIKGQLTDESSGDALVGAAVMVKGTTNGTITDLDGNFMLENVSEGTQTIEISYIGYSTKNMSVEVGSGNSDMGNVAMETSGIGLEEVVVTGVMDIVRDRRTPVAVSTISAIELQSKAVGNVEFTEALKNTPSVYVSNQTGFGDSQMFLRGFDQVNTAFLLNGQPINGMEDGRMYWSNWSGMSDVANAVQIQRGLGSSKLAISSVGGTINIVTKTTDNNEGGYVRFMTGNNQYLKGTFAYNTGLKGKWAMSFLIDHWQADRKYGYGTKGQGQNYFMSIGFKPNEEHNFNFLVTGAPQWHGNQWSQKEEDLIEDPLFNQHWGHDQGNWTTERRNFYHKPVINLSWDWAISEKSKLASVMYASFGRGGGTGPYGSSSNRVRTEDGQVDFDAIRANNLADDDGIGTFGGNYALRASMNNHQWYGNVTSYEQKVSDKITFNLGADFRFYTGDHFRQLVELFGLNSWNESFRHATRPDDYLVTETFDANPWSALFTSADEDQRIAYDYSEQINYQGVFGQVEYSGNNFTVFGQGAISNQSYQREGRWADQGKSDKVNKIGYNAKWGASYNMNEKSTVFFNTGYYSRQPYLDNVFENIRYSNDFVTPDIDNEEIIGFELGYKYAATNFRANLNAYWTSWGNRSLVSAFTNDNNTPDNEDDDFTQRNVERGIKQIHKGVELDLSYRPMSNLTVKAYASVGDWTFDAIESLTSYNDDTGLEIATIEGEDISGVHVPNAPQLSWGLGLDYRITSALSVDVDYNHYANNYRRDRNFDSGTVFREDYGTLPAYDLFDAGVSYKFMLGSNTLRLRANVYNALDHFYLSQTDPFGSFAGNGLTWNVSAKYIF